METQYLTIFLDVVVALVLIGFFLHGQKKGLIMTLAGIVVLVASMLGASFLANMFTPVVTDMFAPHVAQAMEKQVVESFPEIANIEGTALVSKVEEALHQEEALAPLLEFAHFDKSQLTDFISSAGASAAELRTQIFTGVAYTVTSAIVNVVLWVLALVVLMMVLTIVAHALNLTSKLPVVKEINALGGGLIGLLEGALLIYIVVLLLLLAGYFPGADVIDNTYLLRFFTNRNPVPLLLNMIHLPEVFR